MFHRPKPETLARRAVEHAAARVKRTADLRERLRERIERAELERDLEAADFFRELLAENLRETA